MIKDYLPLLILRPFKHWGIVTAELKQVISYGRFMRDAKAIRSDQSDITEEHDGKLKELAKICEDLQPSNIYQFKANQQFFKREKDFWDTSDNSVRQHIKHIVDLNLAKAIRLADDKDIPIIYAPSEKEPVSIDDRLKLDSHASVTPIMNFARNNEGVDYLLQLRIDGLLVDRLSDHRLTILTYEPGLFVIDGKILKLEEGFSAKLLIPFIAKPIVQIPKKMEGDYFKRFILKNVTKAEVNATGFDIDDICLPPLPQLIRDTDIRGRHLLVLKFAYDYRVFTYNDPTPGHVTLNDTDGSIKFKRLLRDKNKEQKYAEILRQMTSNLDDQGIVGFETLAQLIKWLQQKGQVLRKQGFDIVQPSDKIYYIKPLNVEQSDTWQGDWLQTNVTILLEGGQLKVPFSDLLSTILNGENEYMLPTGERLFIPEEWLQRYDQLLLLGMKQDKGFLRHRSQVHQTQDNGHHPVSNQATPHIISTPEKLNAKLRPYQQVGYEWLWGNLEARTGCCLADEMGLGKTVQTIAMLLKYKETAKVRQNTYKPQAGFLFSEEEMAGTGLTETQTNTIDIQFRTSLVVAPASVVHNWWNELQRFAPSLMVCDYTGNAVQRQKKLQTLTTWDVVITTYRTLLNDIDYLAPIQFGIIVFDESQNFKTITSQIHQAVNNLNGFQRVALSGTPVENNLSELWSLMNVLNPNLLGDERHFNEHFMRPITTKLESKRTEILHQLIAPYFLKRTKDEVLTDLPDRQDEVVICPMTETQTSDYAIELSMARNEWLQLDESNQKRTVAILAAIQRLRKIANGEGKMEVVFEHLENLRSTRHKVLIFSEYVTLLQHVGDQMRGRGWTYEMLTGETKLREEAIAHFQQDNTIQFFLVSLKAGGVGINLTAADYVFILDPWWNLSAEEQAIARSHRIGQRNPVFVYRFVSADTLEEQILNLQERKQKLIDAVMPFILRQNNGSNDHGNRKTN